MSWQWLMTRYLNKNIYTNLGKTKYFFWLIEMIDAIFSFKAVISKNFFVIVIKWFFSGGYSFKIGLAEFHWLFKYFSWSKNGKSLKDQFWWVLGFEQALRRKEGGVFVKNNITWLHLGGLERELMDTSRMPIFICCLAIKSLTTIPNPCHQKPRTATTWIIIFLNSFRVSLQQFSMYACIIIFILFFIRIDVGETINYFNRWYMYGSKH